MKRERTLVACVVSALGIASSCRTAEKPASETPLMLRYDYHTRRFEDWQDGRFAAALERLRELETGLSAGDLAATRECKEIVGHLRRNESERHCQRLGEHCLGFLAASPPQYLYHEYFVLELAAFAMARGFAPTRDDALLSIRRLHQKAEAAARDLEREEVKGIFVFQVCTVLWGIEWGADPPDMPTLSARDLGDRLRALLAWYGKYLK